jgi:hypothetical protein
VPAPLHELTRAVRSGERSAPKTVLGFAGIMISIIATVVIAALWIIADKPTLRYLVPLIIAGFFVAAIGIICLVLRMCWKDPSKLMLGQITGRDYALIQRLTLGDSTSGDKSSDIVVSVAEIVGDVIDESSTTPKLGEGRTNGQ